MPYLDADLSEIAMIWWSVRWGLLIAAIFLGAFYFVSNQAVMGRAGMAGPAPAAPAQAAVPDFGSELRIRVSPDGHYYADAFVNSTPVRFLVDTGATAIMLSAEDALRVGLRPAQHEYTRLGNTANGTIKLAPTTLREVRLGGFSAYEIDALVSQAPVHVSLLGMGFLKRLQSWEVRSNQLFLRW